MPTLVRSSPKVVWPASLACWALLASAGCINLKKPSCAQSGCPTGQACGTNGLCATADAGTDRPADAPSEHGDASGDRADASTDRGDASSDRADAGAGDVFLLRPLGQACTLASQCQSTFCADGVCCDAACGGTCRACTLAKTGQASGTCAPVSAGKDPDAECPTSCCDTGKGASVCAERCNGAGACSGSPVVVESCDDAAACTDDRCVVAPKPKCVHDSMCMPGTCCCTSMGVCSTADICGGACL